MNDEQFDQKQKQYRANNAERLREYQRLWRARNIDSSIVLFFVIGTAGWAVHIGMPGAERFLYHLLALQDAADDAVRYPDGLTLAKLERVLRSLPL